MIKKHDGLKKLICRKNWFFILIFFILCLVLMISVDAADTYVSDSMGAGWYDATHVHTVQEGVDNASAGDTVFVWDGTYTENVTITKPLKIIGNGTDTVLVNTTEEGTCFYIQNTNDVYISDITIGMAELGFIVSTTNNVTVTNIYANDTQFPIMVLSSNNTNIINMTVNGDGTTEKGIYLLTTNENVTITDCNISGTSEVGIDARITENMLIENCYLNDTGGIMASSLYMSSVTNATVNNCFFNDADAEFVNVRISSFVYINNSEFHNTTRTCIDVFNCSNIILFNNTITDTNDYGFIIDGTTNAQVINNTGHNIKDGIIMFNDQYYSTNCIISNNTYTNENASEAYGLGLMYINDSIVYNNTISDCDVAFYIGEIHNVTIYHNTFIDSNVGVEVDEETTCLFYDNYIDNTENIVFVNAGSNTWNTTKTLGTNIIGGAYIGGNYWSNYTGTDGDGDGIGDTTLVLGEDSIDYLPLTNTRPYVYVNDDADTGWYDATHVANIQEGIDNSSDQCIIYVYSGTYTENIIVNKSVTIIGNGTTGDDKTYVSGTFNIENMTYVNISEIYFKHSFIRSGGFLYNASWINISNCTILDNLYNLAVHESNNITVYNTSLYGNSSESGSGYVVDTGYSSGYEHVDYGYVAAIKFTIPDGVTSISEAEYYIGSNSYGPAMDQYSGFSQVLTTDQSQWDVVDTFTYHGGYKWETCIDGITPIAVSPGETWYVMMNITGSAGDYMSFRGGTFDQNTTLYVAPQGTGDMTGYTVGLDACLRIYGDTAFTTYASVNITDSENVSIMDCVIENNTEYGIRVINTGFLTVVGSYLQNNQVGFKFTETDNCLIYDNVFDNTRNIEMDALCDITWNISKTFGTNILGNMYLGGNYWSNYTGADLTGDGLGDTLVPHNSSSEILSSGDLLPLVADAEYYVGPPTNMSSGYNDTHVSINASWTQGLNADNTVIIRNNDSYPTGVTDGYILQNTSSSFYNQSVNTSDNSFYLTAFSYNASWNLYSTGVNMPWGAIRFRCFNESNPTQGLVFDIEVTNNDASETYVESDISYDMNLSLVEVPYGDQTIFIISSSGYKNRIYIFDLEDNTYYNYVFYLPPLWSDLPVDDVPDDQLILTSYTDTAGVMDHTVDVNITLDHTPEDITAVYLFNSSIYGGWVPISEDNYSYDSGTGNVTVDAFVLDGNTSLIRVDYTTYESRSVLDTEAYLIHVINEIGEPVDEALVTVKKYINTSGTYEMVSSDLTDGNGDVTFWLIPNTFYKIFITKDGFLDEIANFQPTTVLFMKTFIISVNETDIDEFKNFNVFVSFNASMLSNESIAVSYSDSSYLTQDTQFYVYEFYNESFTLIDSSSFTSDNSIGFYVTGVNISRLHYVNLFFNHSYTFDVSQPVKRMVYPFNLSVGSSHYTPQSRVDEYFTYALGENPLGWGNTIAVVVALIFLVTLGPFHAGLGMIGAAVSLFAVELAFVFNNLVLISIIPVVLVIGVFYILVKKPEVHL